VIRMAGTVNRCGTAGFLENPLQSPLHDSGQRQCYVLSRLIFSRALVQQPLGLGRLVLEGLRDRTDMGVRVNPNVIYRVTIKTVSLGN
jgi:hypothetical protein